MRNPTVRGNPRKRGDSEAPSVRARSQVAVAVMDSVERAPGRLTIHEILQSLRRRRDQALANN
ncbi:MAG: hypothetical protein Q8R08_03240 [bacterium]|nr:hypothetical protein [bacterium]